MTLLEVVEAVAPPIMGDRHVHAMWLEGSYATGNANERSDIDVWLDVDDGSFAHCVHAFRSALASIQQIRAEDPRGIYSRSPGWPSIASI